MIFEKSYQQELHLAVVESKSWERDWLIERLLIPNAEIKEYNGIGEATEHAPHRSFDVIIVTDSTFDFEGQKSLQRLKEAHPEAALMLLADFDDGRLSEAATAAQCCSVLLKHELTADSLTRAVIFALEQLKLQLKAKRLQVEAEQLAQAKSEFAAMVSHEILNPMTGLMGYLKLLGRTDLDNTQASYLKTLIGTCNSLTSMVRDLLSLSRIDNDEIELTLEDFSPYAFLNNLNSFLNTQGVPEDVRLFVHCDPTLPTILTGDSSKLRQIVYNLAQNALKFTDTGHVAILFKKIAEDDRTVQIRILVEDTGRGIPVHKRQEILRPFGQSENSDIERGHGLGLTICKKLAEVSIR